MGENEATVGVVTSRAETRPSALRPEALAWSALVPCAVVVAAAIVVIGPVLGRAFDEDGSRRFWAAAWVSPEATEHGRYLVALLGPLLLAGVVVAAAQRRVQLRAGTTRLLVQAGRLALVAFLLVCLAAQSNVVVHTTPSWVPHPRFFTVPTLLAAAGIAALIVVLPRQPGVMRALAAQLRETRARRFACLAVAVLATATWLLSAVNSDSTIGDALGNNLLPWSWDESFAVLDGRTPLVDFHAQYAQLWPYAGAGAMRVFGTSLTAWSIVMACTSAAAALALYALLRRVVRSSLAALVLYLPLMATGFFIIDGTLANRFSPAVNFNLWPMRYAGPYVLAWLTARHLDGVAPRRRWPLFFLGGLVLVNNSDFGAAAFGGTLLALLCATPWRSWRRGRHVLVSAALGLGGALVVVVLATLARSGHLPRIELLTEFPSIYLVGGWTLFPMPVIGFNTAVYATFAAVLVVAVVRWVKGAENVLLTSMLAWSGTFGLGAGVYYAGRSNPPNLIALFSAWGLALTLLSVVVVGALAARGWRRPTLPELAVLFGFGLACASLVQAPTPWSQIARWRDAAPTRIFKRADVERFVAAQTHPGEQVAIIAPLGHRIAYDLHLTNVSPYSSLEAMPTYAQFRTALAAVRDSGLDRLFVGIYDRTAGPIDLELIAAFMRAGFTPHPGPGGLVELRRGS